MTEIVLPSKANFWLSRLADTTQRPLGLAAMPNGPVCTGMRMISGVLLPASAASRSTTDTSSVPPLAVNR